VTQPDAPAGTTEVARDLPAGVDPAELAAVPSSARRGRLRRRLRYLRAVRQVLLRDLGGFYYEAQRSEQGIEPHRQLLDAKAARLTRLDEEVHALESRLEEPHPETILREPGLGGTCPQCGELHGSDARYCARCGAALSRRVSRARQAAPAGPIGAVPASSDDGKATTASLWGRPKRPDPAKSDSPPGAASVPPATTREPAEPGPVSELPSAESPAPDEPAPTGSERS
jgi:hypothetical protein